METNQFTTQTDPKSNLIYCTVLAVCIGLVAAVAWFLLPQFQTYVFLGGATLVLSSLGTGVLLATSVPVKLCFEGDELNIHNTNGQVHNVYAVSAGHFVFMQTPLEKKYDIGCLRIKGTAFWMFGVKDFAKTRAYVSENFPHW